MVKMGSLGEIVRKLREEKGMPLRTVAAYLDMDQAILSKIERGKRKASRQQVLQLAGYFKVDENELLISWLSDKLMYEIADEQVALKALQVAEEKLTYMQRPPTGQTETINRLKTALKSDGRVFAAWLFGSFARGAEKPDSDIDIMVELNGKRKYSMFDLLDIAHNLEQKIHRKVDLVEKGALKDFALKSAGKDFIQIYG